MAEWLYRAALLHAFSPCGSGDVCREVTQGERTVLCFSDANILDTWQACFCFFADGYPEYVVIVQLPRAALGKERDQQTKKILASLYRSILHFGLGAPE